MKTLKFKTNIKCGGCITAVTPFLNAVEGAAGNWQVDTKSTDKVLTVESDTVSAKRIEDAVKQAGYKAEHI